MTTTFNLYLQLPGETALKGSFSSLEAAQVFADKGREYWGGQWSGGVWTPNNMPWGEIVMDRSTQRRKNGRRNIWIIVKKITAD